MRQFVKLTLQFFVLLLVITVLLIEIPEYFLNKNANFKLADNSKYIVIGHSHSECSFNDDLIQNFTNLSGSGESYFYTYHKAKQVLKQNPSIETVFIEFTNNQITATMNEWTWDDEHLDHRYPMYSPFISNAEKMHLASNNFKGFINSNSLAIKENLGRVSSKNYTYHLNSRASKPTSDPNVLDSLIVAAEKERKKKKDTQLSTVNIEYLIKIVNLCKEHGKKIILVRSPLHESYPGFENEDLYHSIRKKYFSKITYLDFAKMKLDNSNFYDLEHLNEKGSKTFSTWFDSLIKTKVDFQPKDHIYSNLKE